MTGRPAPIRDDEDLQRVKQAALEFAFATGNDEQAALFAAHWMRPIFDAPYAIDSRTVDGRWVHLLHDEQIDRQALRAQLAAAWQDARDAEITEYAANTGAER